MPASHHAAPDHDRRTDHDGSTHDDHADPVHRAVLVCLHVGGRLGGQWEQLQLRLRGLPGSNGRILRTVQHLRGGLRGHHDDHDGRPHDNEHDDHDDHGRAVFGRLRLYLRIQRR